jgi:hypothetical protein
MSGMVKNECVRILEEGALEVLRRTSGSEKKRCWMASLLNYVAEQKMN